MQYTKRPDDLVIADGQQWCPRCSRVLPKSAFYQGPSQRAGQPCKSCQSAERKARYAAKKTHDSDLFDRLAKTRRLV
jgi:hypothetical protein